MPRFGRRSSSAGREATVAGARAARSSFPLQAAGAQGGGPQSGRAPPTLRAAGEPEDGGGDSGRPGGGGAEAAKRGSKRQRPVAAARQRPRPHGYLSGSRELRPASLACSLARSLAARGGADMGAKQSGPAANGRTRAYSGSDLPSGTGSGGGGADGARAARFAAPVSGAQQPSASAGAAAAAAAAASAPAAPRSRSLGGAVGSASGGRAAQSAFSIPSAGGGGGPYGSQDSVHSSPEDSVGARDRDRPAGGGPGGPRLVIGSLPAHLSPHLFGGTAPCPGSGSPAREAHPPLPPCNAVNGRSIVLKQTDETASWL